MTRFLFFLLSPFLLWMMKADAVFAADPPCVYNRSFNACCNNGLAQRIDEYVFLETTEVCRRDTNDCNLSEPSCPAPNPGQCLWGGNAYSVGDVRYQCGFEAGNCSFGSCLGVSYVCSASGDWVSDNPSPQCTSECTDCTGGPPPPPPPPPPGSSVVAWFSSFQNKGRVGEGFEYAAQAISNGGNLSQVEIRVIKKDESAIEDCPTALYADPDDGRSWCKLTEQAVSDASSAGFSASYTPQKADEYYLVAYAFFDGGQCTGNPFGAPPGYTDCSSGNDYIELVVDGTPQCTIRGQLSAPGVIYQDETATFLAGVEVQGGVAADVKIDRNTNDSFLGDDFVQMTLRVSCSGSATCTTNVTWTPTASDLGKTYNVFCRGYNTTAVPEVECRPFEPRLAGLDCGPEDYLRLRVEPPPPWFQTKGGDIYLEGDLISRLPATIAPPLFSLEDGGFPGVVSAKGNIDFGSNVSPTSDWQAKNSQDYGAGDFYYDYFADEIRKSAPQPISDGSDFAALPTGFYIANAELNLPAWETWEIRDGKQIVILAEDNLNIKGKIQVEDGSFLAVIVKEKITIDPSVYEADLTKAAVSGIFIAEKEIQTGSSDEPLVVRGVWAAKGGFILQRERKASSSIPAERFDYDINLVMKAPVELLSAPFIWQETSQ